MLEPNLHLYVSCSNQTEPQRRPKNNGTIPESATNDFLVPVEVAIISYYFLTFINPKVGLNDRVAVDAGKNSYLSLRPVPKKYKKV